MQVEKPGSGPRLCRREAQAYELAGNEGEARLVHPLESGPRRIVGQRPAPQGRVEAAAAFGRDRRQQGVKPGARTPWKGSQALHDRRSCPRFPLGDQGGEQGWPIAEMPIEAAFGDAQVPGQRLDGEGRRAASGQAFRRGPEPILGSAVGWGLHYNTIPYVDASGNLELRILMRMLTHRP